MAKKTALEILRQKGFVRFEAVYAKDKKATVKKAKSIFKHVIPIEFTRLPGMKGNKPVWGIYVRDRRNSAAPDMDRLKAAVKNKTMAEAVRVFKLWHHFQPRKADSLTVKSRLPAVLIQLGFGRRIDYDSDKFSGKWETYFHHFHKPYPRLLTTPKKDVLIILGGIFKITHRGIVD